MINNFIEDEGDIILWPDKYWCFRYEIEEIKRHTNRSDDYEVIYYLQEKDKYIKLIGFPE